MRDWAPSIIATALFALLCPGGVLQMPGRHRPVDLMNMKTSFPSTPSSTSCCSCSSSSSCSLTSTSDVSVFPTPSHKLLACF
ncbi:hypothetical protein Zm00014a_030707 [Zea mays]|uniref:Uncharacterized protein n=2 Tax=Zea mays TaxID=4577 RepID=A0A8J8YRG1_MAIZE|nr:hypothetical protein ZEAMMB73_Zm00001d027681 [Zea mays]PWZ53728.1 hypothetical protein Zm00014a_030707 [Zea mays]